MSQINKAALSIATITALLVALTSTPAQATTTTVPCTTGSFDITAENVVINGVSCTGQAVIPASVTSIGDQAFAQSGITSVAFDGISVLTSIGASSFSETSLSSVTIPASVTSIGDSAFVLSEIASLTFEGNSRLATIDRFAFAFTELTSITIPASVTFIGEAAFLETPITSFTVAAENPNYSSGGDGVIFNKDKTLLIAYPLGNPRKLYSIPDSVTSIGHSAFHEALNLSAVTIPEGVTSIGKNAFLGAASLSAITIPASVTLIDDLAFFQASSLMSVYFLGAAPSMGSSVFVHVGAGAKAYVPIDAPNVTFFPAGGQAWNGLTVTVLGGVRNCSSSGNFTITDFVVVTGQSCSGQATIPDGVISIGTSAFSNASNVTAVTIPASVTSIGNSAFADATGLSTITIPASVRSIGNSAFNGAHSLLSVFFGGSSTLTIIGDSAFASASRLSTITIPDSVTSIGDSAFAYAANLSTINIPASVTTIGESAFAYASSLGSITIPASVTTIENYAFQDATQLSSVTFAGNGMLATIGQEAFVRTGLTTVAIPESVTSIGVFAFEASSLTAFSVAPTNSNYMSEDGVLFNKQRTSIIQYPSGNSRESYSIPGSVTSISDYAFSGATTLSSVAIPESVTAIGVSAFDGASALASVTFSANSRLESIASRAFKGTMSLSSITIPSGVSIIGALAFHRAEILKSVYFLGDAPAVEAMAFADIGSDPTAYVGYSATGFPASGQAWEGLTVEVAAAPVTLPVEGRVSAPGPQAPVAEQKSITLTAKSRFKIRALAKLTGVQITSPKAIVSLKVAKASSRSCVTTGSILRTLKAGLCDVTFTVQEPKSTASKRPKATKTPKSFVIQRG